MPLIQCTKKLLKEMGLKGKDLATEQPSESFPNWHANLIYIERRKCVLFTNDETLLNFLVADRSRAEIRELSDMFRDHLQAMLTREGIDKTEREEIAKAYGEIHFSTSNSRSVLGSMNDLAYNYKLHVLDQGGLQRCDLPGIIRRLNRMPMGAIDYKLPVEALMEKV